MSQLAEKRPAFGVGCGGRSWKVYVHWRGGRLKSNNPTKPDNFWLRICGLLSMNVTGFPLGRNSAGEQIFLVADTLHAPACRGKI